MALRVHSKASNHAVKGELGRFPLHLIIYTRIFKYFLRLLTLRNNQILNSAPEINPRGYSHTLPIRVCAAQRGRDFEAPDLERGIHFRGVF